MRKFESAMAKDKKAGAGNKAKQGPRKPAKTHSAKAASAPPAHTIGSTLDFYRDDFPKTLFPLTTNLELIVRGEQEIKEYIRKCLDDKEQAFSFAPQRRVYAAKPGRYLRRTVKLDPVAEYFIYDVIFRNRALFRKPHVEERRHFGYRFEKGAPIAPTAAFKAFKGALADYSKKYSHSLGVDVASYFNGIYHHDIVSWFHELGASSQDAEGLGQLLREINAGRSLDCLPQGLYPTKMIGNDFLRFIDNYHDLRSEQIIRFMDDIYLFSNDQRNLATDFQTIQRLLGDKGLSVNPRKTSKDTAAPNQIDSQIDQIKTQLLKKRRLLVTAGYDDDGEEIVKEVMLKWPLTKDELKYIDGILDKPEIEEEDAELILTIMRSHTTKVEKRLPDILGSYPHLTKNVYSFCAGVEEKELIADMIVDLLKREDRLMEYQLFWFGAILEEYLMGTTRASALISLLFNHPSATVITKAKILENPDLRFGLPELRNEFLMSGQSDWLAWASAVGSRNLKPITRNHRMKYFGNSSQINHLIATIMLKS